MTEKPGIGPQRPEEHNFFRRRTISEAINRALGRLDGYAPTYFIDNGMDLSNPEAIKERIRNNYRLSVPLIERYGDNAVDRMEYSFKVWIGQISYYVNLGIKYLREDELSDLERFIQHVKDILEGTYLPEETEINFEESPLTRWENHLTTIHIDPANPPIPNRFRVPEDKYFLFETEESISFTIERALPFLTSERIALETNRIFSSGVNAQQRASASIMIVEGYLEEARDVAIEPETAIPLYYDQSTQAYKLIEKIRTSLHQ